MVLKTMSLPKWSCQGVSWLLVAYLLPPRARSQKNSCATHSKGMV